MNEETEKLLQNAYKKPAKKVKFDSAIEKTPERVVNLRKLKQKEEPMEIDSDEENDNPNVNGTA